MTDSGTREKLLWKLWTWKVVTKEGNSVKSDSFNMPQLWLLHGDAEPRMEDVMAILKNFKPWTFKTLVSVEWEYAGEYWD